MIQLQCDKERTGNEERRRKAKRADDDKTGDDQEEKPSNSSLSFVSYGQVEGKEKLEVLRLDWRTKYACEDYADSDEASEKRSGWGFFTWFILMCVAVYSVISINTNCLQFIPRNRRLPHLRIVAQLQPLWCPWLGPASTRRYHPRFPVSCQRLLSQSGRHGIGRRIEGWV